MDDITLWVAEGIANDQETHLQGALDIALKSMQESRMSISATYAVVANRNVRKLGIGYTIHLYVDGARAQTQPNVKIHLTIDEGGGASSWLNQVKSQ